jgi:hypothetical protein
METVKIKRVVSENGHVSIWINDVLVYGVECCDKEICSLSQSLTGTTGEAGKGIFQCGSTIFDYGEFNSVFDMYFLPHEPESEFVRLLLSNIKAVRDWVNRCQSLSFEYTIPLPL